MMVLTEGVAALKSLKSLYDIAREVRDSNDPEKLRAAAAQMFDLSLAAREQTAALQEERNAAVTELDALKAEVARLITWDGEKQNYELKNVGDGCLAYMLKRDMRGTEPAHWLCTHCFGLGVKSFLQDQGRSQNNYQQIYACPSCKSGFAVHWGTVPHWM